MLFNSIQYLIFFPIVVSFYFSIPHRYRWVLLLAASYYFYMCWKVEYIILIIISTLIDYYAALQMGKHSDRRRRKRYLLLSLFSNLGLLFVFKYFNFFNNSLSLLFEQFNVFYDVPSFKLLLPVGISFYTFQTLSYSIDVYRGKKEPEKHLGIFALYVAFFPQLVAGPIERSTHLLPQFTRRMYFDHERISNGLKLMLWGFFKKVVVADRLALYVNQVYNHPGEYSGWPLIIATYFFAFQIYCDFSGYSDIAIGSAQVLGFNLMDNFKRPYFSKSISEFWKRWHISLSTWFRDYLYISLGGNRVVKWRWYYNLFIVFLISGLWHGANWTFVAWGALHGFYLIFSIWTENKREKLSLITGISKFPQIQKYLKIFITFHLVLFSWIFFRANSITDAFQIIQNLFVFKNTSVTISSIGFNRDEMAIAIFVILIMEIIHSIQRHGSIRRFLSDKPLWLRWGLIYVLILAILNFGVFNNPAQFIYFQF